MAKLIPTRGQTSSVHIRFVQVDVAVSVKDGDVVAQPSSIELRVLQKPDNSVLLMLGGLWGVEATGIVFANTDLQEPEDETVSYFENLNYSCGLTRSAGHS